MSTNNLDFFNGKDWDIVASPNAIPAEKYAVEEFQRIFYQATRIQLPIRYQVIEKTRHVFIGPSQALDVSGVDYNRASLGEEGVQIVVEENQIVIVGGRPRGTLYAVYQFLEDNFGVRFLTYDHTHVPDASRINIPYGSFYYQPPFSFRWSFYTENEIHPELAARLRVNTITEEARLGGKTGQSLISHSFHRWVPFSRYGESHPEYYALIDGKRDTRTEGAGPQLCVTNPEVMEVTAEAVINYLNDHPDAQNISVSQADTDWYCRCDTCESLNRLEGTPMGSQLAFVNRVAELVEKVHPKVKIGTLAYWYTRKAPRTIRPHHNVQIQLCSIECCTLHPIDDPNCQKNRAFCMDMDEWGKISDDIWIWNYNTDFIYYGLPFPNFRVIGPNLRFFLRNHAKGVFMQANGQGLAGELSDLRNYLISRMLWNPHLDDQAVLKEFVSLHYQNAAQPILDYIQWFHDHAEKAGVHPACFPKPAEVGLSPEIARKTLEYFNQALELADNEMIRARVEKASICAYRALIETGGPVEEAERKVIIARYILLCQTYNMTHSAENIPFDSSKVVWKEQ